MEQTRVSFPEWKEALAVAGLSPAERAEFRREILAFLHLCKVRHVPATVILAKEYLAGRERQGAKAARPALRWFFRHGQAPRATASDGGRGTPGNASQSQIESRSMVGPVEPPPPVPLVATGNRPSRGGEPPEASKDTGGADWERDLITASRSAGFLWRTEETYRGWAARFVRFLAPRSPYAAEAAEVADFLTHLAVESRASPSTQKQALNALVFFMQEGLHRQLGEIDFQRAFPQRRVPTVLAREECQRLFAAMEGTPRLMAELAYGAGLRVMGLLRLRVHHVDFARNSLVVHAGKGDRVEAGAHAA